MLYQINVQPLLLRDSVNRTITLDSLRGKSAADLRVVRVPNTEGPE